MDKNNAAEATDLKINEKKCCTNQIKYNYKNDNLNSNNNTHYTSSYNQKQQQQIIQMQTYEGQQAPVTTINYNSNNYRNQNNNLDNLSHTNMFNGDENGGNCNGDVNNSNGNDCLTTCKINFKIFKRSLPCIFAWLLLLSTTSVYFILAIPELLIIFKQNLLYWLLVVVAHAILFIYTTINFAIATFRDPGRYPKVNIDDTLDDTFKSPLYKNVFIKNTQVKTKWCSSCNFYRPLRCSHCSVCDSCIDQFDHHCPWLANCVGKRNYRFFLQFLFFLILHMIAIFSISLLITLKTPIKQTSTIASILLLILCGLLIFPIGGLFVFHLMLISKGRTTNEQVTGKYKGLDLFHRNFCLNFFTIMCTSLSPKLITANYTKKYLNKKTRRRRQQQIDAFEAKYKTGLDNILLT